MDDTLYDYKKVEDETFYDLNKVLSEYGVDKKDFWSDYDRHKSKLLRKFAVGSITKEDFQIQQYSDILKNKVSNPDKISHKLNEIYINNLKKKIELFQDVKSILYKLKDKAINMAILSNGYYDEQLEKYKLLQLYKFMPLYVGEKIGFEKPSINSYSYVLVDLSLKKSETIMISNSISDYNGAINSGINAVLIDRNEKYKKFSGKKIKNMLCLMDEIN